MKYKKPTVLHAHILWKKFIKAGDIVIDATCGRGFDSLSLASLALTSTSGSLHCIDIQKEAVEDTKSLLMQNGVLNRVNYHNGSHESFSALGILDFNAVSCIVYNLGYLPRGNKKIITVPDTTLRSLENATCLLKSNGGLLSVAAYRGHAGGQEEYCAVSQFFNQLQMSGWKTTIYENASSDTSPVLLTAMKRIDGHCPGNNFLRD